MMKKFVPEYQTVGRENEHNYEESKIYFPKKSLGWLSILIVIIIFLTLAWISYLSYQETQQYGAILSIIIFAILAFLGVLLFIWFFKMKYELTGDKLILHFGPLAYVVDLYIVERVEKKNLVPSIGIGVLLPGFAKWVVNYKDEGKVFMCSTRATRDVLIIKTKAGYVGITPEFESQFLEEINSKIKLMGMLRDHSKAQW